jgi:hypothetical protein
MTLPAGAQQNQKPFTQDQVQGMVRDGLGDESGAKLIEQRGIDFVPSEDSIQTLKAAGASEAFLNALRAAVAQGPLSGPAALPAVRVLAAPPQDNLSSHGPRRPNDGAVEDPQGRRAGLALRPFLRAFSQSEYPGPIPKTNWP